MSSQHFLETDQHNQDVKHEFAEQMTSNNDEVGETTLAHFSGGQTQTIIVRMNSKSVSPSSSTSKLKSLLPKNLLCLPPRSEAGSDSQQLDESSMQTGNNLTALSVSSAEIIMSQPIEERPNLNIQAIEINPSSSTNETLDTILQQWQSSFASGSSTEHDTSKSHAELGQALDKSSSSAVTVNPILGPPETAQTFVTLAQGTNSIDQPVEGHVLTVSLPSSALQTSNEHNKEQEVIKKTVVEAFVKMVVCRKVTVQKVNTKTGQVLDTKVKTEEEEPVILGVDCVETTEELISPTAELVNEDCNTDLCSSKWGTSLDGGLKFLSAVSESRQKIGKSLRKDKLFKGTTPHAGLLSKVLESEQHKVVTVPVSEANQGFSVKAPNQISTEIKSEVRSDSEMDWNEEFNDDSEDYIPNEGKSSTRKSTGTTGFRNIHAKTSKQSPLVSDLDQMQARGSDALRSKNSGDGSTIVLQKKRGRKRKWGNALGISSNLRTCQFCKKHFSSIHACAKHMRKGKCVSAVHCFICSKPFSSEAELEGHLLSHGSERTSNVISGVYACKDCNRAYRTRAGYVKHFRMGTCLRRDDYEDGYTGDFKCDICESRFSTEAYLRLHRYKVHENPKDTHTCPDCGKQFYSSQGFNKHRAGRPCTEPLKCKICGKTYSSKAKESFKIHMKHHKSEVTGITFECDECGRTYMTQMALTKHKLSHTGVKPYKCEICGKEFSMRYMVKDHARMHTGERPYLCSLCGSAFSNKGHLARHLRSHENGTLLKRGRPKKVKDVDENSVQETELKMIDLGQTLQNFDGQTIQVVDGQMFDSQTPGTPMIIQANNNTIIIAEGWPTGNGSSAITLPSSQTITEVTANVVASAGQ